MGWFDIFSSFEDMIDDKLYYIKYKLKDWVEMIAFGAIMFYEEATGVGKTIWEDLELWLNERIDDFLPNVLLQITSARQLAQYLHDTLKMDLEKRIDALSGLPEQVITLVMSNLEPKIVSARQYAEYLTDTLDIEIDKRINSVNAYTKRLHNETLATLDSRIGMVMAAMGKIDEIAGAARAQLIKDLEVVVLIAKNEALAARNVIKSNLDSAIKSLKDDSTVARKVLQKTLNKTIDLLEREAKQAREVLEGTLIQIIEGVEDALETALTDLERRFKGLLDMVINRVDVLESWIDNFTTIFDKEINKYQSRVVTWIVDGFESILDRVFK